MADLGDLVNRARRTAHGWWQRRYFTAHVRRRLHRCDSSAGVTRCGNEIAERCRRIWRQKSAKSHQTFEHGEKLGTHGEPDFQMCEKFIAEEAKAAREEAEQRMRELMEEEELFCLEDENNTTNNTTNDHDASQGKEEEGNEAEDMWAGGCRGGVKKRKDHVLEVKNDTRGMLLLKRVKIDQTPFTDGDDDDDDFVLDDKTPGIVFCRDAEQVAALTKNGASLKNTPFSSNQTHWNRFRCHRLVFS